MKALRLVAVAAALVLSVVSQPSASANPRLGATVTGFVVAPEGVDGDDLIAKVELYQRDGSTWRQIIPSQHERGGTFAVDDVRPGEYLVRARIVSGDHEFATPNIYYGDTYDVDEAEVVAVGQDDVELEDIHTEIGGTVRGRVTDENGDPLPGRVEVSALSEGPFGLRATRSTEADDEGRYELNRLGREPMVIGVGGSEFSDSQASGKWAVTYAGGVVDPRQGSTIEVTPGAVRSAPTLAALRNAHLTGVVLGPDGRPAVGVTVETRAVGPGDPTTDTDDQGRWDLGPLRPDTYLLEMSDDDKNVYARRGNTVFPSDLDPVALTIDRDSDVTTQLAWASPIMHQSMTVSYERNSHQPVGTTVSATPGEWLPADSAITIRWMRNGKPIPGATDWSYTVTEADTWKSICPEVTAVARGMTGAVCEEVFEASDAPIVSLTATPEGRGEVALTVEAASRGVDPQVFDGSLRIGRVRKGSDIIGTRTIDDGTAKMTLTRQPKGKQTYFVILDGKKHVFIGATSRKKTVKVR